MAGLMTVTAFLSMWINNSAAANVMIPTAISIVNELQNYHQATKRTAMTDENDEHQNSPLSARTDSTSKKRLYFNNHIVNRDFLFIATLEVNTCSDEKSTEQPSVLKNIVVVSYDLNTE
jgi:hypothetical protein